MRFLLSCFKILPLFIAISVGASDRSTVYFVLGSDTAIWNWPGGINTLEQTNHFTGELYTDPKGRAYRALDPSFRGSLTDSFGSPLKLTWWMLVGSVYGHSDNNDVPIPNLMPLHLMNMYHGQAIRMLGDELTLHYHTFLWSDYNGDGRYYWNQAKTFHECRADFDRAIAEALIEENVFTVTFRSGWHFMDDEWQNYANQLWPYNMDNDSPNKGVPVMEPRFNALDWSQAPVDFVPFHPSSTNYQASGDGTGWNVRSVKMPNVTQKMVDSIFLAAGNGTNQVVSFWAHLPEADFLDQIARMDLLAHVAATNHPAVKFRYCTAVEAMQRWRGTTDVTPPKLDVTQTNDNGLTTLHIKIDEPIFQKQPFVAFKDICQNYRILGCSLVASNEWTTDLPLTYASVASVGIAVTDEAGNLTTRLIPFVPNDQFVDNSDSGYSEPLGKWTTSSSAAWGVNSRFLGLPPGGTGVAQWVLPVVTTGTYVISIQVPPVTNPPPFLSYEVWSAGNEKTTTRFSTGLPERRWIQLATLHLDAGVTNLLMLTATGDPNIETAAATDVVRLSPLVHPPNFIRSIKVNTGTTTANILWETLQPSTSRIEFGEDLRYGRMTATYQSAATNHVQTLTGLKPGTSYQFEIVSRASGVDFTAQGEARTSTNPPSVLTNLVPVFEIEQIWSYTTNNLDRTPWTKPEFDDSSWPTGPGLLWVDLRSGSPNQMVQPKGTELPHGAGAKYPYTTYYFRTRFTLTNQEQWTSLIFTNYIDDGAVFYLDGIEIHRNNLPTAPLPVTNKTSATGFNCGGDATCPIIFTISREAAMPIASGEHTLAVEVHNFNSGSPDITFGSSVVKYEMVPQAASLDFIRSGDTVLLYWNGEGYTLQQSNKFQGNRTLWDDVTNVPTMSPWPVTDADTMFFRLKK